jgi:hypothetical protein
MPGSPPVQGHADHRGIDWVRRRCTAKHVHVELRRGGKRIVDELEVVGSDHGLFDALRIIAGQRRIELELIAQLLGVNGFQVDLVVDQRREQGQRQDDHHQHVKHSADQPRRRALQGQGLDVFLGRVPPFRPGPPPPEPRRHPAA